MEDKEHPHSAGGKAPVPLPPQKPYMNESSCRTQGRGTPLAPSATPSSRSCAGDKAAAGQGTAVATHQELQHFLGVRVHFNDLLVKGRDLGTDGRGKV